MDGERRAAERLRLNSGRDERACLGADAVDHGDQTIGALRRQVFAQAELIEDGDRVGLGDFPGRASGIERDEDAASPRTIMASDSPR